VFILFFCFLFSVLFSLPYGFFLYNLVFVFISNSHKSVVNLSREVSGYKACFALWVSSMLYYILVGSFQTKRKFLNIFSRLVTVIFLIVFSSILVIAEVLLRVICIIVLLH
jgi:hypothetical protein